MSPLLNEHEIEWLQEKNLVGSSHISAIANLIIFNKVKSVTDLGPAVVFIAFNRL